MKGILDSETKERQASIDKLNADLRSASKLLGDQVAKEAEERCANHADVVKLANTVKALTEQESAERRASQDDMRKRHKQLAELVESEKSNRDLHCTKLDNQLHIHGKNHDREKEARIRDHDVLKSHLTSMEDRLAHEMHEMQSIHENNLRKAIESTNRSHDDLRSALDVHVSATAVNAKETDSVVKMLQQQLEQEVKVRAAESVQASAAIQDAYEKMQLDTGKLQKVVGDHGDKIKGLLESLEKEKVERENNDNNIKLQLNTAKQELLEEKEERGNDCGALKRFVQNLEAQVSSHLEELRMSHETEVSRNNAAHEKVEQAHRDLKNGLEQHGTRHEETTQELPRAIQSLKKMAEQETKAREADSLKTATALDTLTGQLEDEATKSAKMTSDLTDKLKRVADELSVEVQGRMTRDETSSKQLQGLDLALQSERVDRERGDAALRAQIQNCETDLEKEKESRLNDTAETRRGVQSLEGSLSQHLEDTR